jgi:hypothetical protein
MRDLHPIIKILFCLFLGTVFIFVFRFLGFFIYFLRSGTNTLGANTMDPETAGSIFGMIIGTSICLYWLFFRKK